MVISLLGRHRLSQLWRLPAIVLLAWSVTTRAGAAPTNIGDLEAKVLAYANGGQYDRDLATKGREAMAWLNTFANRVTKPALVLDIDETSLRNLEELEASQFGYFPQAGCSGSPGHRPDKLPAPCGSKAWDSFASTPAIAPTLALFQLAIARHVTVFFITGRHERERAATEANLKAVGYVGYQGLYMEDDSYTGTAAAYKTEKRQAIRSDGYHIILNVGDQPSDLAGGISDKAILYPDPFYRIK